MPGLDHQQKKDTAKAMPKPAPLARHWRLDPGVVFLNHGSFGACPIEIQQAQQRHRDRVEAEAVSFFCRDLFPLLDRSRRAIAGMIGGKPEDYVFPPNATVAVATIIMNLERGHGMLDDPRPLGPGDEILVNDHEYPACLNIVHDTARRTGARVRTVEIPTVPQDGPMTPERFHGMIMAGVTDRTRICLLSHITSPTGMIVPAAKLVRDLEALGVVTILDGAHGPGAIPLDIDELRPAFYTANCHKWLCTPKGAAILYVRPDLQEGFRPLAISNYAEAPAGCKNRSMYNLEFDYTGTDDYTARLTIADAIDIMPTIAGAEWPGIIEHNRSLVMQARDVLLEALGAQEPVDDRMIGPLAMVPLPEVEPDRRERLKQRPTCYADALQDALVERHGIQVPVWLPCAQLGGRPFDGRRFIRLSAQLYNSPEQYRYLADALAEELAREMRL
ncbi:MAG: aminotransferase class V-fold PLP-dependent enzyme [Planctomycetota bacterium]